MYSKIVIAGGTGFLGQLLINKLKEEYDEIVVLTRKRSIGHETLKYVHWDAKTIGNWAEELEGADALINLTGKSVDCRYTLLNRLEILNSRVEATQILQKAIDQCLYPPTVWINASSATIYRHAEDKPQTEATGELGSSFSETVCKEWESAFFKSQDEKTRKVAARIGIVLSQNGGAFPKLLQLVKFGVHHFGNGLQMMSWIDEQDFVEGISFLIRTPSAKGIVNLTSPTPITNIEFLKRISQQMGNRIWLPLPKWILEIGAYFIKTETELILKSRWVLPKRLQQMGYQFFKPEFE